MSSDGQQLSDALLTWVGHGEWAERDTSDARVRERFGEVEAEQLLPQLRRLLTDFYDSDASLFTRDPKRSSAMAAATFGERHPEIHEDAIAALAELYAQDFA